MVKFDAAAKAQHFKESLIRVMDSGLTFVEFSCVFATRSLTLLAAKSSSTASSSTSRQQADKRDTDADSS